MFSLFKKEKKEPENIGEVLAELRKLNSKLEKYSQKLEELERGNFANFSKLALLRFNPFKEVGGNQSFALCLLNKNNDGFLLTGIYTREKCRIFAKPIYRGKSNYPLLEEEKEVLRKAIRKEEENGD